MCIYVCTATLKEAARELIDGAIALPDNDMLSPVINICTHIVYV